MGEFKWTVSTNTSQGERYHEDGRGRGRALQLVVDLWEGGK